MKNKPNKPRKFCTFVIMIRFIYIFKLLKYNIIKSQVNKKYIFEANDYLRALKTEIETLKLLL